MKTAASEVEKPQSIQQKSMHRKSETDRSQQKSENRKGDAHRRSHSIQPKVVAAVRLSQKQPSDEDEHTQNSTACVDGHRAAVQEKDTAHVEHLTHGAKRHEAQVSHSGA